MAAQLVASATSATDQPPTYAELITRAEAEQILRNMLGSQIDGKLLDYSVRPEPGPVGYLGEYFHLRLRYQIENVIDHTHERQLFVKALPYQNVAMTRFIEESGILRKEAALYERLLNQLRQLSETIWCAECYYTRRDLFVMQNIVDLGYEPVSLSTGFLGAQQMRMLLKGLATMHASSIAYEIRHGVNIGEELKDVLYEVTVLPTVEWYTAGVRAALAVALEHPSYQSNTIRAFIKEKLPKRLDTVYEMVNASTKYRNVLCHRDPWGGNLFFHKTKPHDISTVFVDFQLCRYCPAAIDVLLAVYLNIAPRQRKVIAKSLYRSYYTHFAEAMQSLGLDAAAHMTQSEFERSVAELRLFGVSYNCLSATILRVPGDYLMEMKLNRPADFHRYTNVDRTKEVLELVRTDRDFREHMFDCIEEMMELVWP